MSFPRYPEYKDSGVAWLGEVPAHWLVTPIKRFGRLKGGAGFPHERQGVEGEELDFHKVNALGSADAKGMLLPSENTISLDTAKTLGAFVFPSRLLIFSRADTGFCKIRKSNRVEQSDAWIGCDAGAAVHQFHA